MRHRPSQTDDHSGDFKKVGAKSGISHLVFFGDSLTDNGNLFALTGSPAPPYWQGRFSNGPTYAEQLPALLAGRSINVQNYAYGGATAAGTTQIDLDTQVQSFIASLHGHQAAKGTEAVLYIGNNDYLRYDPATGAPPVAAVTAHIKTAIDTLHNLGVEKIVVFTLPDFSISPAGQATDPALVAGADAIIAANNAALKQLAAAETAAGTTVIVVDANVFAKAVGADFHAFGLQETAIPIVDQTGTATGIGNVLAPNEIGFFDAVHPTTATHGLQAAFAEASLTSDQVSLFTTGNQTFHASNGSNFVFAVAGSNTFYGGAHNDVIYSGNGNSTVHGGAGNDLIFAGGGNNHLYGDGGTNLLAVNSGDNALVGGTGFDVLIVNRAGNNTIDTGGGDNLIIFKENAGATFGHETVVGGHGDNTLRFIINDQNPASEQVLLTEFKQVVSAYNASLATNHHGTFSVDGLDVQGITGIQLQIDSVDMAIPYQINHTIVQSIGERPELSSVAQNLMHQAALWGLLTV